MSEFKLGLTQDQFVTRLKKSQDAVFFIANYILAKGYKVYVPKLRIAPDQESREQYSDEIDLIFYRENELEVRVEVKQLNINFTDIFFPYERLIVNSITGYKTKKIKPDLHILLSKNRLYAAIIDKNTFNKCYLKQIFDKIKFQYLWFYCIDYKQVKFVKL